MRKPFVDKHVVEELNPLNSGKTEIQLKAEKGALQMMNERAELKEIWPKAVKQVNPAGADKTKKSCEG